MKNIIAMLLALSLLCFAGCGKDSDKSENKDDIKATVATEAVNDQEQESEHKGPVSSGEITMEQLLNAPESPAEDFIVVGYGDDIVKLEGYTGASDIVVIPESLGITHIAKYIFNNDTPIRAIRLSDTVRVIELSAFTANNNLELVALGDGMIELDVGVFQNCENLREIKMNEGLQKMGKYVFSGCGSLKEVVVPTSATELDALAFFKVSDDFTLVGEAGSAIEEYANTEGIPFRAK